MSAVLARVELPPEDLPETYVVFPAEEFGLTPETVSSEDFTVSNIILLMDQTNQEFAMALLFPLEDPAEQTDFDAAIADPELFVNSLVEGMAGSGAEVTELGAIPGLEDIGDSAAGYSFSYEQDGTAMQVDVVVFRRSYAGAAAVIFHTEGSRPQMGPAEFARLLDTQIAQALR